MAKRIEVGERVVAYSSIGKPNSIIGTLRQLPKDRYEPYLVEPDDEQGYEYPCYSIRRIKKSGI